jgi:hypothetical protein
MKQERCRICGDPIKSKDGCKPRMYCDKGRCRQKASKQHKRERARQEQMQLEAELKGFWRALPLPVSERLEMMLTVHGLEAARYATDIVKMLISILPQPQRPQG